MTHLILAWTEMNVPMDLTTVELMPTVQTMKEVSLVLAILGSSTKMLFPLREPDVLVGMQKAKTRQTKEKLDI